jgi:hypothetical protein
MDDLGLRLLEFGHLGLVHTHETFQPGAVETVDSAAKEAGDEFHGVAFFVRVSGGVVMWTLIGFDPASMVISGRGKA